MSRAWGRIQAHLLRREGYNEDILLAMSSVAVFPRLNLVFNRIKKSGNTSVATFLFELDGGTAEGTTSQIKRQLTHVRRLSLRQTWAFPRMTSLAVVRNPYARLLSGYLHRIGPGHMPEYKEIPGFGAGDPAGFAAFVRHLEDGALYFDRHYWPQTDLMFQPPARFDHILRLEHLVPDMAGFLETIGQDPAQAQRLAKPHQIEQAERLKVTGARSRMQEFYSDDLRATARRLYAADFAALPVVDALA